MDLTIRLADQDVQVLKARATSLGVSPEEYVLQVLTLDLAPAWLRESWESAKESGLDQLSADEIDEEIGAARKARRASQARVGE